MSFFFLSFPPYDISFLSLYHSSPFFLLLYFFISFVLHPSVFPLYIYSFLFSFLMIFIPPCLDAIGPMI
jgi:hypothetical protein